MDALQALYENYLYSLDNLNYYIVLCLQCMMDIMLQLSMLALVFTIIYLLQISCSPLVVYAGFTITIFLLMGDTVTSTDSIKMCSVYSR